MKERAVKEWPDIEMWRDPARPGLGLRFGLDFKNPTEGFPELMRYVPQQRVNALVEALEFYADYERNYLDDQPGEPVGLDRDPESGMWEMDDYAPDRGKRARTALANYKEGEA